MCQISDSENVARAIFSPRMVYQGHVLPAAFELRAQICEEYLSVMRIKDNVTYDVKPCDNNIVKSHAGIFITVNKKELVGGRELIGIENKKAQDFMLLSIRQELAKIAQRGLKMLP